MQICFIGFEWKGIKKGLRGYGVNVWLKPKAEPNAYGDAGAYGDEVDEDFEDRDNEDGGEAHVCEFVEGGRGQVEYGGRGIIGSARWRCCGNWGRQ